MDATDCCHFDSVHCRLDKPAMLLVKFKLKYADAGNQAIRG